MGVVRRRTGAGSFFTFAARRSVHKVLTCAELLSPCVGSLWSSRVLKVMCAVFECVGRFRLCGCVLRLCECRSKVHTAA